MTLILTVNGPESIWLLADRRLIISNKGRPVRDDACKVISLQTTDALAILGYTGLGATASRTEPSDWMSAVLRGRNLPLEQSLNVLAEAIKKQFPPHMVQIPAHSVIVPAFVSNEARLYTIDMVFAADRKSYLFRCTRHVNGKPKPGTGSPPRLTIGGTGGWYLYQNKEKLKWERSLRRIVKANDRGQVTPHAVADHLAKLNNEVHLGVADKSVGPRCIVMWQHRKGRVHKGGSGLQLYTGATREMNSLFLPTIVNGMEIHPLLKLVMRRGIEWTESGHPEEQLFNDELNAEAARLPDKPDEKLR
jgi:hypothetical protein